MKTIHLLIACFLLSLLIACSKSETPQSSPSSFEELSEQGRVMCRKGNYIEGLKLLQEANNVLASMDPDSVNPEGAVKLLGNISNLYNRMGLFEEAKQTNSEAISIADARAVNLLPDLWRMRGTIYEYNEQPDSEIICLHNSVASCKRIEDEDLRNRMNIHNGRYLLFAFIENPEYAPDSIPMALRELERINYDSPTDRLLIGRAYVLLGDYKRGIPKIEKSVEEFRRRGDTESVAWGLQLLAQSYTAAHDNKLLDIYTEASSHHDTIMQSRSDNHLLGMDFKYRTSQLKREKAVLESELLAKRQRIIFISVIAILIVAAITVISIMRNRDNRRRLRLKQQNIDNLLSERIALNSRIEQLNQTITENENENKRHEILSTILLGKEDEQRFRKNFNDLHPNFIDKLRLEYPGLTSGNELLCMLIALNRRNEEIALALGISRESVATSRYRLRTRFNLSKDVDLNDFIQSRL